MVHNTTPQYILLTNKVYFSLFAATLLLSLDDPGRCWRWWDPLVDTWSVPAISRGDEGALMVPRNSGRVSSTAPGAPGGQRRQGRGPWGSAWWGYGATNKLYTDKRIMSNFPVVVDSSPRGYPTHWLCTVYTVHIPHTVNMYTRQYAHLTLQTTFESFTFDRKWMAANWQLPNWQTTLQKLM